MWVSPFGNRRIAEYLLLPAAYRSLSRPSSAPDAKASTLRSLLLDLPVCIALHTSVGLKKVLKKLFSVLHLSMYSRCLDISLFSVSVCSFQGTI